MQTQIETQRFEKKCNNEVKLQIKLKCHKLCHVIAITYCTV